MPRIAPTLANLIALLALLCLCSGAPGQPTEKPTDKPAGRDRPSAATRFVCLFDFEEARTNPNPVPRYWARVYDPMAQPGDKPARPVLPIWNQAELVFTASGHPAKSGEGSVRLPTAGGSTRLILESGVIPVFAGADYKLSAAVRTAGLHHARARVVMRFLDHDGLAIAQSERSSGPILSEDAWTSVSMELVGDHPAAAYLQIQLDLLQPALFLKDWNPARDVRQEDFEGAAYFDDVLVIQLPRAELTTTSPLNLIVAPAKPELTTRVRDLTGEELSIHIDVYDALGNVVDTLERPLAGGVERIAYTPALPALGWYRAVMAIRSPTATVGEDYAEFAWLPPTVGGASDANRRSTPRLASPDRARFGIACGPLHDRIVATIEELPRRIGTGAITLDATGLNTASNSPLARAVSVLLDDWQDVTLGITWIPISSPAAARPLEALASDKSALAAIEPLLDRFGQRIRRYQFGTLGDDLGFWSDTPPDPAKVEKALRRYVSGPIVSIPMRLDREAWARPSASVDLVHFAPYATPASAIGDCVLRLERPTPKPGERQGVTVALECPPESLYAPRAAAADVVRRAVEAWAADPANVPNLTLIEPWSIVGPRRPQLMPRAELAAWRSLVDRLIDRRVVGRFPSPTGTTAYLLAPVTGAPGGRTGAIVAWNDGATQDIANLDAFLGPDTRITDIFGNDHVPTPAPRARGVLRDPGIRVPLTAEPVFIEGVDVDLARFLVDFRVDPVFIQPGSGSDAHEIVMKNPFRSGISGTITLIQPSRDETGSGNEWRINPRIMRFAIPPGQEARLPVSIAAGSGLEQGPVWFVYQVDLSADRQYPPLEIRREMTVGLSSLKVDLSYRVQGAGDLVLEAAMTNIADRALSISLTAFAPGQPRQPATVSSLSPSNQAIRRFVYPGLAAKLRGQRLSVTVADADANARLGASILIE